MPVGPEFEDPAPPTPPPDQPYFFPPLVAAGFPFYETAVTVSGMQEFQARAGDTNPSNTLTARWLANYPPATTATTVIDPSQTGDRSGDLTTFKVKVTCQDFSMGGADHNLAVIISDHGFLDVKQFSQHQEVAASSFPYNFDNQQPVPQIVATMTSWRIVGCP